MSQAPEGIANPLRRSIEHLTSLKKGNYDRVKDKVLFKKDVDDADFENRYYRSMTRISRL